MKTNMIDNQNYLNDSVSNIEYESTTSFPPISKLARMFLLPASDQEMNYYVANLMVSDAECLRTYREQAGCEGATD